MSLRSPKLALLFGASIIVGATLLPSRSGGYYSSTVTRSAPSCGNCHRSTPGSASGFSALNVAVTPSARSLTPSQSITIATQVTGGQTTSGTGGFSSDVDSGAFSAGTGSRLVSSTAIVQSNSSSRSWTYGYTAGTTPGVVQMWVVGMTSNGNSTDDSGDFWAFHGSDQTATQSTPVRLYVNNASGVTPNGDACVGSYGNYPVLGARLAPTIGNANFAVEVYGAAPAAPVAMLLGQQIPPIDLGFIGITGCNLYVQSFLTLSGATGAGNAQRGEGVAIFPVPIPNAPVIRGARLQMQAAIVDVANGRRLPITATNGLLITVQ